MLPTANRAKGSRKARIKTTIARIIKINNKKVSDMPGFLRGAERRGLGLGLRELVAMLLSIGRDWLWFYVCRIHLTAFLDPHIIQS